MSPFLKAQLLRNVRIDSVFFVKEVPIPELLLLLKINPFFLSYLKPDLYDCLNVPLVKADLCIYPSFLSTFPFVSCQILMRAECR